MISVRDLDDQPQINHQLVIVFFKYSTLTSLLTDHNYTYSKNLIILFLLQGDHLMFPTWFPCGQFPDIMCGMPFSVSMLHLLSSPSCVIPILNELKLINISSLFLLFIIFCFLYSNAVSKDISAAEN